MGSDRIIGLIGSIYLSVYFFTTDQFSFRGVLFSENHTRLIGAFWILIALCIVLARPKKKRNPDAQAGGDSEKSDD